MSLDHFPLFTERRFQPTERSSYSSHDHLISSPSSWSYSNRPSTDDNTAFHHHIPSWNTPHYSPWNTTTYPSPSPPSPTPYLALPSTYRHSTFTYFPHSDFPPSSSRPLVPSSLPSSLSPAPSTSRSAQNTFSSIAPDPKFDPNPWGDGLYTIDDPESASNSEHPASSVATSPSARASSIVSSPSVAAPVKVEPEDSVPSDCFVMEFSAPTPAAQASSSLAPPTEVPLRATQASKAMRKMMGVFRLNPFSMHESGGQPTTTWTGEEAGPLEEEPQMFEFQLDLPGYERAASDPPHSLPPPNKLDRNFDDSGNWTECSEPSLHHASASHAAWLGNDSPPSYPLPSLRSYSPHPSLHSPSPSAISSRRTPLDNASSDYASPYILPMPSSCAASIDNLPSISTMARRWSNTSNHQHPFMI